MKYESDFLYMYIFPGRINKNNINKLVNNFASYFATTQH